MTANTNVPAEPTPTPTPTPTPIPPQSLASKERLPGKLTRWFELQSAALSHRYRFVDTSAGVMTTSQDQFNDSLKGRFKFDAQGKYSLHAGLFTGNNFTAGWDNSGWGTGHSLTNHYLKQLYFVAKPVKGVELQVGSLYIKRGESTEITTYDNDGYIMGERLILTRPKDLFFDEIAVTYAYLGDLNTPNINKRYHRLRQSNYHQFLVSKNLGRRAIVSADYSFQAGAETLHQGVTVIAKELRAIDTFRFEAYQRTDVKAAFGFAVNAEKALHRRFTLGGGYADIDPNYGGLNADRFNKGRRLYLNANWKICTEFSVSAFWGRAVANNFAVANRNRLDVIFSYNLMETLRRTGYF